MKARKLLWVTLTLITASAMVLTGSLALLAGATENETTLDPASAVPEIETVETEGEGVTLPGENTPLENNPVLREENGKVVASFLSPEELTLLQERRDGGEWFTLSLEEMTAIVEETVRMFYASHVLEVGALVDGVYTVESYNGYLFYTSDEYTKKTWGEVPNVALDVFNVILAQISAYNDAIGQWVSYPYGYESGYQMVEFYYAYGDMPSYEGKFLDHSNGHVCLYDEETGWSNTSYDYLKLNAMTGTIELYVHDTAKCFDDNHDESCCEPQTVFYAEDFKEEFVTTHHVEGSKRVRVEIYEEATQTLVDTFVIDDQEVVEQVFDGFLASFQNACDYFNEYVAAEEDQLYRGKYRVIVHMESVNENLVASHLMDMDICYPYGYSNDVYGYLHDNLWMDYQIQGGSNFIEIVDAFVDAYIPAE